MAVDLRTSDRRGRGPEWFQKDLAGAIGIIFALLFRRIGDRRLPPYAVPRAAEPLFAIRAIVSEQRKQYKQERMDSRNVQRREYYEVVKRNLDRARLRLACEHAKVEAGSRV